MPRSNPNGYNDKINEKSFICTDVVLATWMEQYKSLGGVFTVVIYLYNINISSYDIGSFLASSRVYSAH